MMMMMMMMMMMVFLDDTAAGALRYPPNPIHPLGLHGQF